VSTTKKEALSGGIKHHPGDLDLNDLTSLSGVELSQFIRGSLNLNNLESAEGIKFPKYIARDLDLRSLK
jgi:hypothetical protein